MTTLKYVYMICVTEKNSHTIMMLYYAWLNTFPFKFDFDFVHIYLFMYA